MRKQVKKVTLNGLADKVDRLATTMEAGFKDMKAGFKKVNEDVESLAKMTSNGFEDVTAKMATKDDIARLEKGQAILEQGQENIQLRVDSLAPQFEVKGLERRVKRLEDRAGIRHAAGH